MSQLIYNFITLPASVLLGVVFLFSDRGRKRWLERFGFWKSVPGKVLWLHGASVGEVNGLCQLIPSLREVYPDHVILVTATSVTGLDRGKITADFVRILPFDCFPWISLAVRSVDIQVFMFGETEIWPALLHKLHEKKVPCFMVNATISDFTFKRYSRFGWFLRSELGRLSGVAAANQKSAERLIRIGVSAAKVVVTGNSKYDNPPSLESDGVSQIQSTFFSHPSPIIVLGSLRPGEEEIWFSVIRRYQSGCRWIVVPRHKEKFDYFRQKLNEYSLPFDDYSLLRSNARSSEKSVILLDQMGLLESVYSFASLAFIGATLVPNIGGHNPLEAAVYGTPVVVGPYYRNVQAIIDEMLAQDACYCVSSEQEITGLMDKVLVEAEEIKLRGERGKEIAVSNRGATTRAIEMIRNSYA